MQKPSFSIYDASAGSGKTYALVKEYLKIILTAKKDDAYRNILAITFTNKAVHEMKSRIIGNLSQFASDTPDSKAMELMQRLSAETGLSNEAIHTKAKNIIRHIIHNYAAFDISTIDKFTHKVIRAFAHDLNLPMTFEVTLDTENLLTEAVDALIAQAGEDETLTKLLIDFTMEKTDDDKSWDISREILETGRLILNENNRSEITHFQQKTIAEFIAIKNKLNEASKQLEAKSTELALLTLALIEKNGINLQSFSAGHFPNHLRSIAEEKYNPKNKRYFSAEDIKINKTAADRAIIESITDEMLELLASIYKNYEKRDFYRAFLKNITPLSLLNTVNNELTKIQSEQNILSISEFNAIIHREIQNQPAPFIYERLGERYRHFFIDEFQDTSEMQWQNLIPLIDNATSAEIDGEKGTLMIVGDPKQSVYRWRGGKAEQFIALSKDHNPFNNPEKIRESLDTNYRSYSEIIDFNNKFFKYLSAEFTHSDYKDLYENHSHQKSNDKTGGYVNLFFLPEPTNATLSDGEEEVLDKTEQHVLATLNTIQKVLAQGFQYKDIVVLTRKRSQGIAVANYLTEQNVPILSSETLMIANAAEVRLLIHILKYLKNNGDLEAKAHFLQYLGQYRQSMMPTHDFIAAGMALTCENEFEKWLYDIGICLSFSDIRRKSLYETVEILILKVLVPKVSNAYLQYFLDIVLERDVRNQSGIIDFLNYWDKNAEKFSIPSPEGKDAVRIMTIHKSKGLEFPVVIMPFSEEDYTKKPKDRLWVDAEEETFGLPVVLIDNTSAVEGFGVAAAEIYNQKKQEELLDNINVLYVALTRAEEQLYIISSMALDKNLEAKKNSMAGFFINYLLHIEKFDTDILEYEFGSPGRLSYEKKYNDTSQTIKLVTETLDHENIKIAQRESLMWGTVQQEAIEYGNVIHEILSFIKTQKDIDSAIFKAIDAGLISALQREQVEKTITEIITHPDLGDYFSDDSHILNEQAIIQKEGGILKPDRMVLKANNEILLLDYKTGLYLSKHESQLQSYQDSIEKMGFKVTKKALLYIGEVINIVNL